MHRRIRTFTVFPYLPERLKALHTLAYNMWWSWNQDAVALFRRIDDRKFSEVEHSAIRLLGSLDQNRYEELVVDEGFLAHLDRVTGDLHKYMTAENTWFHEMYRKQGGPEKIPQTGPLARLYLEHPTAGDPDFRVAYFSAEFGIHESLPVYSGGLGVLAGDHLKSASDLGIPLVGIGLMYRLGYFRQYLNQDGWQQERYLENDFFNMPLIQEHRPDGKPILVEIPFPHHMVRAKVWRIQVGRVPLYLLDCNVPENNEDDRGITSQLYGGDQEMRIRQELVLGIGGLRALRELGIKPTICHMNEGHAAFLGIERIRMLMEEHKLSYDEAREAVTAGNVFTTHTPVPAGNDVFPTEMIDRYLGHYKEKLHIDSHHFHALGRQNPNNHSEAFCMTVLALKLANVSNGVSKLHGHVSRKMWKAIWSELPDNEVPITSITNGVHTQSWLSREMTHLFERYLGLSWLERPADQSVWKRVENIPDGELWRTHERRRERLVLFARERLRMQLRRRGAPLAEIHRADEVLDPEALTLGFARRFATYKRGTLLFRNLDRLSHLLSDKDRPVQIIFSGKAHPRDHGGKELIAEIVHMTRRPELRRNVVFIEDYDYAVARYLVQGVDVWVNNPRRPLEASGTSGMKASVNGGLNLSILDGWWCEAHNTDNGWAIGAGEEYTDLTYQDDIESRAAYDLIEQELVPQFYNRGSDGIPRAWLHKMKRSFQTIVPVFNTHRMLQDYLGTCYWPSYLRFCHLMEGEREHVRQFAQWRRQVEHAWPQVQILHIEPHSTDGIYVGRQVQVDAKVRLGALNPSDVEVQLYHGLVDSLGEIPGAESVVMSHRNTVHDGVFQFTGSMLCRSSGQHGFTVRVLPRHPALHLPHALGKVCWGN